MEDNEQHYTPLPPVGGGKSHTKFLVIILVFGLFTAGFGIFAYLRLSTPRTPPEKTGIQHNDISTVSKKASSEAGLKGTCIQPKIELEVECMQCNGDASIQQ